MIVVSTTIARYPMRGPVDGYRRSWRRHKVSNRLPRTRPVVGSARSVIEFPSVEPN